MEKVKKSQFHVTLAKDTINLLDKFCDDKLINKSKLVDWVLVQYLKKENHV